MLSPGQVLQDLLLNDPCHAGAAARVEDRLAAVASSAVKRRPLTSPRRGGPMPPPWSSPAPAPVLRAPPRSHSPARHRGHQHRATRRHLTARLTRGGLRRARLGVGRAATGARATRGGARAAAAAGERVWDCLLWPSSLPRKIRKASPLNCDRFKLRSHLEASGKAYVCL